MIKQIFVVLIGLGLLSFMKPSHKLRIFMAGDSTMSNYDTSKTPQRGWGQIFHQFFNKDVEVINLARGGRSTKSFIAEGLWDKLMWQVQKDDWVFIEFGHNDHDTRKPERFCTPDEYEQNLIRMVHDVQAKGGHAILLTPIAMRSFNKDGSYRDGHGAYPAHVKTAAKKMGVPFIDADSLLGAKIEMLGEESSKGYYMNFGPGLYKLFPEGHVDNTHLRTPGALEICALVANKIKELQITPINQFLKQ